MKKSLRFAALFMVAVMMFTLAACGKDEGNAADVIANTDAFIVKDKDAVELGTPEKKLDAASVYSKITYNEKMFQGNYSIIGISGPTNDEKALAEYIDSVGYVDYKSDYAEQRTAMPFSIEAGVRTFNHIISNDKSHNWMRLSFFTEKDGLLNVICAYTVEGNTLKATPIKDYKYDEATKTASYGLTDIVLEYEFEFKGFELTLKSGDKSVTMNSNLDAYKKDVYFGVNSMYLSEGSACPENIDMIRARYDGADETQFYIGNINDETAYNGIGKFETNGLFTFTAPWKDGTKTYQYVYFYCGFDGIILADENDVYYFNSTYGDRNWAKIGDYLVEEQAEELENISEDKMTEIVAKKDDLLGDLVSAFETAGVNVTVNTETGEMAMDSSVLFGGDSDALTDDGKAVLDKFVTAYTSVINNEKYNGFVSKTMVEGHVAPVTGDTYEDGLPLSESRANNVKDYCVTAGLSADALQSVAYSNSRPVKDADGNVDMAASRRVSFRFMINLG